MAWAFDDTLLKALRRSHRMITRVDVFDADGLRRENVPILGGNINATLLSDVSRSGTLTVSRQLVDQGLFDPRFDKVRIRTGVEGFPLIPIFTGRVQSYTLNDSGSVQIPVADHGDDVVEARLEKPWVAVPRGSTQEEMRRLLRDVDPTFSLQIRPGVQDAINPSGIAWTDNRAQALDDLAAAMNAVWAAGRSDEFVLFPNPFKQTAPPTPLLTLTDGPDGTLTSFEKVVSRDGVYNSVTLEVQRADGGEPLRVTARDNDPNSPTFWGGKFGKRNQRLSVQVPYGLTQARLVASRMLRQSLALALSWRFSTPHFPLLDPGDVIVVDRDGVHAHVIETISYPLEAVERTSFTSRELRYYNDEVSDLVEPMPGGVFG